MKSKRYSCVSFVSRFKPSITTLILLILAGVCLQGFRIFPKPAGYLVLILPGAVLFLASWLFFPRIVVTVIGKTGEGTEGRNGLVIWADGKRIYRKQKMDPCRPFQFTFQVWRNSEYVLLFESPGPEGPEIKPANTYDHHICHVTFGGEGR